jgi:NADH-quinone oxidoreductase subunit M
MILTLVTFIPAAGALAIAFVPKGREAAAKAAALGVSLLTFAVSLPLWIRFDSASADYQFVEQRAWMPTLGISYHLGIDGISLLLVLLTTFLMPLVLLSAWHAIESRVREFAITMLLLETGMLGVLSRSTSSSSTSSGRPC